MLNIIAENFCHSSCNTFIFHISQVGEDVGRFESTNIVTAETTKYLFIDRRRQVSRMGIAGREEGHRTRAYTDAQSA